MKTRILRTLSLATAMVLLLMCLPAIGESLYNGQMSITVGNAGSKFTRGGIVLDAYLIARGEYGDWTPVSDFSDIQITARDDGSAWIDQSMKQLAKRIKDRGLRADASATTHVDGKANFTSLEHGIYFVQASKVPDATLTVTSMLLSTPNKEGQVWITANAKYEYTPQPDTEEEEEPEVPGPVKIPVRVPMITVTTRRGERLVSIDEYETALGLGNIQMHVGVCFE